MMKRLLSLFLCVFMLAGCGSQPAAHSVKDCVIFTDHVGAEVQAPRKPGTVAVLSSSLADLWLTAGGTVDITVGESVERGFVDETVVLVDDGAGKTVNLEALIAAKPDFVLFASDIAGQLECAETLRAAGIPAAGFAVETFDEYLRLLKIATDILETPEHYETYGLQVQENVDALCAELRRLSGK